MNSDSYVTQDQCSRTSTDIRDMLVEIKENQGGIRASLENLSTALLGINKILNSHDARIRKVEWKQAVYAGAIGVILGLATLGWMLFRVFELHIVRM